ncbi:hypothetical protein [Pseudoalteromonas tetraodonis]|uniref:hypothetical protein n=1 Tax=Pseudoalteromonas tetraodonis TaxID=43659 RepID=UPI003A985527
MYKIPDDMQAGCIHKTNNCGDVEVIYYKNAHNVCVKFVGYDYKVITSSSHIRNGKVLNRFKPKVHGVGYLGVGPHKALKTNDAYTRWAHMLQRCYSGYSCCSSYSECTVCDEWHNFQNFADWHCENYPKDGGKYEIDKDIKNPGNKVYGPEACLFVTRKENASAANAKTYRLKSPDGDIKVIYNLKNFCRDTNLNHRHLCEVSNGKRKTHKGWSAA